MKYTIGFALAIGLVCAGTLGATSSASAQVVIQGQVTTYPAQPQPYGYAQPQPYGTPAYGASPYVSTGMGGAPQPVRYIHRSAPIVGLLVPGIIALGVGWLGGALVASGISSNCRSYTRGCPDGEWAYYQWIPIVGPWLSTALANGRDYNAFSYVTGALQDVGLILFILGLVIRDEWDEPLYAFGEGPTAARLYLAAGPTSTGASMSATLTF